MAVWLDQHCQETPLQNKGQAPASERRFAGAFLFPKTEILIQITEILVAYSCRNGLILPCQSQGTAADSWFAHLAFGVPVENTSDGWLEPVSDEEYDKLGK